MAIPTFTGRYASIKKEFYKGIMGRQYTPGKETYVGGKRTVYKTEAGFRTALKRQFDKEMAVIDSWENAGYPVQGTLTAFYPARSYQARATLSYKTSNGNYKEYRGGPTGGWGYDKMSSASAEALNQAPEFRKLLMDARAKKKTLPYGVSLCKGEPYFPRWDGGVGIECHAEVLKALGYEVKSVRTGIPDSQTYTFTLKKKVR